MCSILGIVNKGKKPLNPIYEEKFPDLLSITSHRGPDESRIEKIDDQVLFGSNRLSIVDIAAKATMPIVDSSKNYWIVYNGEIYNFQEIRNELLQKGYSFQTHTDTEVILYAYIEWGEKCIDQFNGMFAFVIWDRKNEKCLIARDRFGIKPLYYYEANEEIIVSSDIRPILNLPNVKHEIDEQAMTSYMLLRFIPGAKSIVKNVYKLECGQYICWDLKKGTKEEHTYWKPSFKPLDASFKDATLMLRDKYKDAVERVLMGDVKPGVLLSGGIDSSSIVAMMYELGRRDIETFSCRFEGKESPSTISSDHAFSFTKGGFDESHYVKLITDKFNTKHTVFTVTENDLERYFVDIITAFGEPNASTDAIGHYFLAKMIRDHTKVVLAGVGADELLGGYINIYFKEGGRLLSEKLRALDYLYLYSNLDNQDADSSTFLNASYKDKEYIESYVNEKVGYFPIEKYPNEKVNEHAFFEIYTDLSGWELEQGDRMYMASAVELRPVFLENQFANFALQIPSEFKYKDGIEKKIFKEALRNSLPKDIIERQKFPSLGTPSCWYQKKWFNERVDQLRTDPLPFWDTEQVSKLFEVSEEKRDFEILYRIIVFEEWYRTYF